jgi:glutamate/tyrosine decarboxylase-like PLP-dependent enzyme
MSKLHKANFSWWNDLDNIVTAFDQSVQMHLPDQSVSTQVDDKALSMLVELLNLGEGWNGKVFTTGATSANTLGMACGREVVIQKRLDALGICEGVGELGILTACMKAGIREVQVLTSMCHSSLYKAASIVGLGRSSVKDLAFNQAEPWRLNLDMLEWELAREKDGVVSIVAISAGEVNTGRFATDGLATMTKIRALCDKYGAWLHVDGGMTQTNNRIPLTLEWKS